MKRPNANKLQDLDLLAIGVHNLCMSLQDRSNSGSAVSLSYLSEGMENKVRELCRAWETIKAQIHA